jgi:hypothetical protein
MKPGPTTRQIAIAEPASQTYRIKTRFGSLQNDRSMVMN